ncbi:MAG TPA: hypothetical protein VMN82_11445 [Thermoanaerobaculia bacterium]|nr:hypothetical protein [Thermoanaerobaculia bacterium]
MRLARTALLAAAGAACLLASAAAAGEWRPFSATWTLAGTRTTLPTEGARPAAVVHVSGSLVTTKGDVIGRGFYGEVIGFDDGGTLLVGRAVFTDERGDKVFATLRAQPLGTGRTATGTITGGTGRWAGLEGDFTFSWTFVVEAEGDELHALSVNVEGRARKGTPAPPRTPSTASAEPPK